MFNQRCSDQFMKIKKLVIKNFKNITNLSMENIPDLVVIAGPNGSGKTSIFEAIRVFKAAMGPYTDSDMSIIHQEVNNQLDNFITLGKNESTISIGFELDSDEISYLKQQGYDDEIKSTNGSLLLEGTVTKSTNGSLLLEGTVTISKSGSARPADSYPALSHILSHYDATDKLGAIMYIPAFRDLPSGNVGDITLSSDWEDQQKTQIMGNIRAKFQMIKQNIPIMLIYDQTHTNDQSTKFIPQVQKIFKDFFFPKEFLGVNVNRALSWSFPIKYNNHTHDIDYLSSGEKEILMTFIEILKLQLTGSIILFDEPDLHLNAALEKKIIRNLDRIVKEGNQIWVITHSLEIIGSIPIESLYKMKSIFPENDKENMIELCSEKRDKYEIFNNLGATTGIQLISDKIVYVEGSSDIEILRTLFKEFDDKICFIETNGVKGIQGISHAVGKLMDQATEYDSFLMIRDRDFLTDDECGKLVNKYENRVHVLTKRNIENLLLDPNILCDVFNSLEVNIYSSAEIQVLIKTTADKFKNQTIKELIQEKIYCLFNNVNFGLPKITSDMETEITSDMETEIIDNIIIQKNSHIKKLEDSKIRDIVKQCINEIETDWDKKWNVLCDGKVILQGLIDDYIKPEKKSLNLAAFRSLIASKMKEKNSIPLELTDFFKQHGYDIANDKSTLN